MRNRRGFTIVELAVVVLSLAVLAAVLVPAVGYATQQQAGTSCIQNMRDIGTGLQYYVGDWGVYPAYAAKGAGGVTQSFFKRLSGKSGTTILGPCYVDVSALKCQEALDKYPTASRFYETPTSIGWVTHYSPAWPGDFVQPSLLKYPEQTTLMFERWVSGDGSLFTQDAHARYRNVLFVSGAVKGCSELAFSTNDQMSTWSYFGQHLLFGCLKMGTFHSNSDANGNHARIPSFRAPSRDYR